ncbi:MAG: hypothetical protein Q8N79_08360 [Candidatus Methanoperedens sp.]|nr:hypothetical protein [Candidatus Methanoperedens sp.]
MTIRFSYRGIGSTAGMGNMWKILPELEAMACRTMQKAVCFLHDFLGGISTS